MILEKINSTSVNATLDLQGGSFLTGSAIMPSSSRTEIFSPSDLPLAITELDVKPVNSYEIHFQLSMSGEEKCGIVPEVATSGLIVKKYYAGVFHVI